MAGSGFRDHHIIRGHRNCHRMRTLRYCAVVMGTLSSPLLLYLTPSSFLLSHYHHHYCCLSRHHHLYCLPFIIIAVVSHAFIIFIASLLSSFLLPPFYHLRFCSSSLRRRPKLCLARGEEKQATSLFRREPENIIVVIYKYK